MIYRNDLHKLESYKLMSCLFWPRECSEETALSAASAKFLVRATEEALDSPDRRTQTLTINPYAEYLLQTLSWLLSASAQNVQLLLQANCLRAVRSALGGDLLNNNWEIYYAAASCFQIIFYCRCEQIDQCELELILSSMYYRWPSPS